MTDQRYVGPADLHDARIVSVDRDRDSLIVNIRSNEGRAFGVRFHGVRETRARDCEGMMLYALVERGAETPRQYVFSNWDEDDSASLEITADGFEVIDG
jgi:hypothetical protein